MPRLRLTEKTIGRLPAPTKTGKPALYWDDGPRAVRGFGVLCSGKSSSKTYVAQRDLPNGRTRRVTIAGVNEVKLDDARKSAADMLVEMRRGIDPKAKKDTLTLREVLDAYRTANAHRLRPRSEQSYQSAVERHLSDWLDRPLLEITRDMVEARHRRIAEDIETRQRKAGVESAKRFESKAVKVEGMGWTEAAARYRAAATKATQRTPTKGHATANGTMRALRLLWNFAADKNPSLGPNPVRLRKQWFDVPRRERVVSADELPRFYEALMKLENPIQRDYLRLLLFTGLRRREGAGLRWADVDLKGRVLRIPAAMTKAKRKLDLPLSDITHDTLVARRALGNDTYVFPANSKSGHLAEPKFALNQIAKISGIRISVHDLRRTFITVAESCDISPLALKMLVNHAVGGDVTSGYVIMTTERLREPAQKVANRLKTLCGIAEPTGANVAKLTG
jgi:integrase